jgi:hypothetical protein
MVTKFIWRFLSSSLWINVYLSAQRGPQNFLKLRRHHHMQKCWYLLLQSIILDLYFGLLNEILDPKVNYPDWSCSDFTHSFYINARIVSDNRLWITFYTNFQLIIHSQPTLWSCMTYAVSLTELGKSHPSRRGGASYLHHSYIKEHYVSLCRSKICIMLHKVSFHTYMLHGHSATQCLQQVLTYDENILL